jgi:SPX domain protein involved in polyphosphate accumulation
MSTATTFSVLERHELKYIIPYTYVEPISRFIAPYCQLDYYSELADNSFYNVNSLYFDTHNLEFLQKRLYGAYSRMNMRVRTYGDGTKAPYFMEIKHKKGAIVKKYRATANEDEWPYILTDPGYQIPDNEQGKNLANKKLFLRLATAYAIEPKILTCYRRRAFFSTVDEYARVTMDIDLQCHQEEQYNIVVGNKMCNYDNETIYANNTFTNANVILELKSNVGAVPVWMLDLIQSFNLIQEGFSKYLNSSLITHYDNGSSYMGQSSLSTAHFI